jgi:hypothetical protein
MKNIKIELKWAIYYSILVLLWMCLEKWSGLHDQYIDNHPYLTNLFFIPAVILIILAVLDKKKYYKGKMSYIEGLRFGILLAFLIALFSPLTQWITSYVISPHFFMNAIKRSVEIGYFATTEEAEEYFNFTNYVVQGVIANFIMIVVIVAIVMIFVQSKKKKKR